MSNEDLIEERKATIAREVIKCLDELYDLTGETITIQTLHHDSTGHKTIVISDKHDNKLGINIHKIK
jgi:hypothetical protein